MGKLKKPLAATGIVCVALVVSLLSTWLSVIIEEKPDLLPEKRMQPPR